MTIQNHSIDLQWLKDLEGKTLISIQALVFSESDCDLAKTNINDVLEALNIKFSDMDSRTLACHHDGSSLYFDIEKLKAYQMDDYGEGKIIDLAPYEPWEELIGSHIISVSLLMSQLEKSTFAIQFIFGQNRIITIANIGDNLIYTPQLHPDVILSEKAQFIRIF